mmetsp:Transcript_14946/g.21384  ORF Transcript_14946/g.21384 Transcript_14946/m.21384 type:complete len:87 (+) Transcript_14946:448-708(+)
MFSLKLSDPEALPFRTKYDSYSPHKRWYVKGIDLTAEISSSSSLARIRLALISTAIWEPGQSKSDNRRGSLNERLDIRLPFLSNGP